MTTQRLLDLRRRAGPLDDPEPALDERSMRIVELALAFAAIGVVVLLAAWRG